MVKEAAAKLGSTGGNGCGGNELDEEPEEPKVKNLFGEKGAETS